MNDVNNTRIEPISPNNLGDIFKFECAHRAYFASVLPPRPPGYFVWDSFAALMEEILAEQAAGACYMYIIRDGAGKMVGRVNFSLVQGGNAEIGCRIAPDQQRKGHASRAVALACKEAFTIHGLHRLEAGAAPENIASQIVLLKNGFQFMGRGRRVFQVNGVWQDSLLFDCLADLEARA